MGTTYSNCQVRSDSQDAVAEALLPLLKEPAYVAPVVNGWVGVYPEGGATDPDKLAKQLSAKLSAGVFCWMVHDSDVFYYTLYENGKSRDTFNSDPDWGTDPDDEYAPPPDSAERKRVSGKPEVLVQYCVSGVGYSQVQAVLHPPLSTVPDEDLPTGPKIAEKHLLMFSKMLKTTPDAMRQEFKQLARRKYQFAEEQASDLAKLLGIDENLEGCEYRDVAEANGNFADRQFRLVGNENLSQEYRNAKLWASFRLEDLKSAVMSGADVNARDNQGVPLLIKIAGYCLSEQIQYLITAGADVNAATLSDDRYHALHVELGATLDDGFTALMAAAGASREHPPYQPEAVQLLLNAGADINARTETGKTALNQALKMIDPKQHQGKIGRHAPEEVLQHAAGRSVQVVEMLRATGATE